MTACWKDFLIATVSGRPMAGTAKQVRRSCFDWPIQCDPSPVTVLKIHGSENFHRDRVIGSDIDKEIMFTVNASIFPVSGRNRHFISPGDDSSDAIIAPSFVKGLSVSLSDAYA